MLKLLYLVFFITLSLNSSVLASTTVNLITTNDMHGVLESSNTAIGIAQVSAIKNSTENALLIDSGDATQGTSLATINKGNDIIKLMNAAGYDCMVAGNHEFDYGSEQLLKNAQTADFPILSANAVTANGTLLPATHIITEAGKKIGFVGITTSTTNTSTNPALRPGVTFSNEITAAKQAIASLDGQVDTIVLLTHLGDNETVVPVTSKQLLDGLSDSELANVSAVLDGHSHTIESEPYTRGELSIPVIQDETQLSHVGKVAITFGDDGTVSATEQVMDYTTANAYEITAAGTQAKEQTTSAIEQVNTSQKEITSQVIGSTQTPLWGGYIYWDYAEPRIVETSFGDLASDAFKDAAQNYATANNLNAEVLGIINGGGIASSIDPGQITYGNILDAFNHGNMMVVIQTTPAELYQVLEAGIKTTGQANDGMLERESVSGSFIQASGFSYTYDPAGATGSKVTSVVTDKGTLLSRDDTSTPIIIGTQNYVQQSFPESEEIVMLGGEDTIISDYISNQKEALNYPANEQDRILIANDKSPETYTVKIPVYDSSDAETQKALANVVVHLTIDNGNTQAVQTDSSGNLNVTVSKGAHSLTLTEADKPVYVNNYSGSGTNYTRDGYYSLSFVAPDVADIPATSLTLSTDSIDLSPQYGSNTYTVTATVLPADTTDPINWSIQDQIASIVPNGNSVTVTGVEEGRTILTCTCGDLQEEVTVIVSNNPIIATDFYVSATSPDEYTVNVIDVHSNRDISNNVDVEQVAIFTWSDPLQNDMNCKVVQSTSYAVGNYSYTFPVNNNAVNNYYLYPSLIDINIYASSESDSNGNMIGALSYNYVNTDTASTGIALTPYCSNLGFITPTVGNNVLAGAPNLSQPLEGIRLATPYEGIYLIYSVHVKDLGWLPSQGNGGYAGTMHLNKPIEAVKIVLGGSNMDNYTLTYQTVAVDNTESKVCTSNEIAGTTGQGLALKGIRVNLVPNN